MTDPKEISEHISIQVSRWLRNRGYSVASCLGISRNVLIESDCVGILKNTSAMTEIESQMLKRKKHNSVRVVVPQRRIFLGTIWIKNPSRHADGKTWFFEAYGRKYFDELYGLTKGLHLVFRVAVELHLVREQPESEVLSSDFDLLLRKQLL